MNIFKDYYFWFSQPTFALIPADKYFFGIFLAITAVGLIAWGVGRWSKSIYAKLLGKISTLGWTIGLCGLFWFGLRYENTPIFSDRYWAGLVIVVGVIWLGFILKYLLINFPKEKAAKEREMIKNKYLPKS